MIKEAVAVLQIRFALVVAETLIQASATLESQFTMIAGAVTPQFFIVDINSEFSLQCAPFHIENIKCESEFEVYCKPFSGYILDMDKLRTSAQILEGDAEFRSFPTRSIFGTNSFYAGETNNGHLSISKARTSLFPLGPEPQLQYGQGTIEFWYQPLFLPPSNSVLFDIKEFSTEIRINESATGYISVTARFGATNYESKTAQLNLGSWNHIAVTLRDAVYADLYLNGERVDTIGNGIDTIVTSGSTSSHWRLGLSSNKGYFNDFRVSKNVRYTGSGYNIPTTKLVNDADTYILFDLETYEYEQSFFNQNETYTFTATDDFVRDTSNNRISSDVQDVYEFPSPDVLQIENAFILNDDVDVILTYNREDFDGAINPGIGELVVTNTSSHVKTYNRHNIEINNNTVNLYDLEIDRNYISATPTAIFDINNYTSLEETTPFILDIPVSSMVSQFNIIDLMGKLFDDNHLMFTWFNIWGGGLENFEGERMRRTNVDLQVSSLLTVESSYRHYGEVLTASLGEMTIIGNARFDHVVEMLSNITSDIIGNARFDHVVEAESNVNCSAIVGMIKPFDINTSVTSTLFAAADRDVFVDDIVFATNNFNMIIKYAEQFVMEVYVNSGSTFELDMEWFPAETVINWGDGTSNLVSDFITPYKYHTYNNTISPATITINTNDSNYEASGPESGYVFSIRKSSGVDVTAVIKWPDSVSDMSEAFRNQDNLTSVPARLPSAIRNVEYMLADCFLFNQNINSWDVSKLGSLKGLFYNCNTFNQPLNNWDVSNVVNFYQTFAATAFFNQPLNDWDVSSVGTFNYMFWQSQRFNQPLNNWNTSNANSMTGMFGANERFNQDLSGWCVTNITSKPQYFDLNCTAWALPRPVWGTCP